MKGGQHRVEVFNLVTNWGKLNQIPVIEIHKASPESLTPASFVVSKIKKKFSDLGFIGY